MKDLRLKVTLPLSILVLSCGISAFSQTPAAKTFTNPTATITLTLQQAEELALKNNPRISVAKLLTYAQAEVKREVRSAQLPGAVLNLTAVEPHEGSRIAAGGLNNPIIYERAAGGLTVSQLITDFGRTRNLVSSADFRLKAQQASEQATVDQITFATDQAFFDALTAQALLKIAQATTDNRQTTTDQVQALADSKLRSDLDLSFANVNLAQAKLFLLDAQNRQAEAFANLNTILGFERQQTYVLQETTGSLLSSPPTDLEPLLTMALQSRPDLVALDDQYQAEEKFRRAEHDLSRPTLNALGSVGQTPIRADQLSPWFGAVGVNLSIPVFNGFLFSARAREGDYRTNIAKEQLRDLKDRIARDVQVTWLTAQSAYQKVSVSQQLLAQSNRALDLAQTRYQLGLGSIVELSQAQLQQTEAAIGNTNAQYAYKAILSALRFQTGQ